jgi:hypothetical protein
MGSNWQNQGYWSIKIINYTNNFNTSNKTGSYESLHINKQSEKSEVDEYHPSIYLFVRKGKGITAQRSLENIILSNGTELHL